MTREDVERIVREARSRGERANLRGADLRIANLSDADLRYADLGGANLVDANLSGANLSGADLRGANLSNANLRVANLSDADPRGANLVDADLRGADLRIANLSDADLRYADLRGAYLSGADLRRADLSRADLSGAYLNGAQLPEGVPAVANIDAAILAAIDAGGELAMVKWHTCATTHCRAGWAITLAGDAGRAIEERVGPSAAGALIYAASGSHPTPDWHAKNEAAIADLRERASRPS